MVKDLLSDSWAVALRDLKRDFNPLKEVAGIVLMLSVIIILSKGFNRIVNLPGYSQDYTSFFVPGIIAFIAASAALGKGFDLVMDRDGFGKLLLVAPISRLSILIGKMISLVIGSARTVFVMLLVFMLYIGSFNPFRMLLLIIVIILTLLLFLGIAYLLSSFIYNPKTAEKVFGFAAIALLFLSGIFYPINALPKVFTYLFYLNPLTYAAEAVRYAVTGQTAFSPTITISLLIALATFFSLSGIHFYDKKQRK